MDFELSDEHQQIRRTVRDFAEKEVAPYCEEWEREEYFPIDLIKRIGQLGFFSAPVPEEYGGTGQGWLANAIVAEELARVCLGVAYSHNMQAGTCPMTILNWGTEEQKKTYLPKIINCEMLGCFAVTEPNAATDVAGIETTAIRKGDHYLVNGSKTWITHGTVFDVGILFAKTDPTQRHKGLSAFIITSDLPGIESKKISNKLGIRISPTAELFFDDCRVPAENLLGKEGEGFTVVESSLAYGRISVGVRGLGLAQACLESSVRYANEREQFGAKIGTFQLIKEMIAEMAVEIEATRLMIYQAATLVDQGRISRHKCNMAKYFGGEVGFRCAERTARIYGAYSYSGDFPAARYFRDSMVQIAGEGHSNILKIVIANHVLGWKLQE
ncbi:acyl-CoA dehydrogenase family protein [Dehalococcoidia bacterium]|nr:acyl-CoA dehydrogenase family protein [Dehalococcoidia bacterium]MCL0089786.1 acyl-CoA dehydrogenase family protein [Dehalococcoidia bacterium]